MASFPLAFLQSANSLKNFQSSNEHNCSFLRLKKSCFENMMLLINVCISITAIGGFPFIIL